MRSSRGLSIGTLQLAHNATRLSSLSGTSCASPPRPPLRDCRLGIDHVRLLGSELPTIE